ncbi:MAG TPA: S24 family peptidase [Candidatus Paceibacterota bacterium]|nr:S24 family peptidase [Candidatus Paceibacterota bacterium]
MHDIQQKLLALSVDHDLGKLSYRQIGKLIGTDAPQKVKHHLLQLEQRGLISINRLDKVIIKTRPGPTVSRSLISVAILGSANCGPATIYADQNIEGYLRISGRLLTKKKGIFAIQASGYSMNKANINGESIEDGDYVIVDPEYRTVKNGDYVLSIIDGTANIKRYFNDKQNRRVILLSESSASFSPIFIHYKDLDRYLVNGKIIQVIKKPKTAWSRIKKLVYRPAY